MTVAARLVVQQPVGAVEAFLDDAADVAVDRLGRRARIRGRDHDPRRRKARILRDRKLRNREHARDDDCKRNDPRKDGTIDEERWHRGASANSQRRDCACRAAKRPAASVVAPHRTGVAARRPGGTGAPRPLHVNHLRPLPSAAAPVPVPASTTQAARVYTDGTAHAARRAYRPPRPRAPPSSRRPGGPSHASPRDRA